MNNNQISKVFDILKRAEKIKFCENCQRVWGYDDSGMIDVFCDDKLIIINYDEVSKIKAPSNCPGFIKSNDGIRVYPCPEKYKRSNELWLIENSVKNRRFCD